MKNNIILNLALGGVISIVAFSLIGGKLLSSKTANIGISTASITEAVTRDTKQDTLLNIQTAKNSGCSNNIELNDEKLLALPQQQFVTHHSWSSEAESFSGPLLQDVLATTCDNTSKLKLTALNDYAIDMDFTEVKKYQPIVALSVNGKRLSVREKGPLWVMLPLDQHKLNDKSLDGLMIWQLSDITILQADDKDS